ncbi:MAG: YeiH family protein [bacterium]|nr:YeiH family protein [bacterium]
MIKHLKTLLPGLVLCVAIATGAYFLGKQFPIVGGAVFGIVIGMCLVPILKPKRALFDAGIKCSAKKILQWAVILLGFGLNLKVVAKTGLESLPIIVSTIAMSLFLAWLFQRLLAIPKKSAILVGVGSSICGGSAIAAAAPVVEADDSEIAQSISVIFFFNVLAALIFPSLGVLIGFDTLCGDAFGIFAGTAVNDTSSVTACASSWDSMHGLGVATLDKAVTVKLTRTLAIIPIVIGLTILHAREMRAAGTASGKNVSIVKIFPFFILYFILASVITTMCDLAMVKACLETCGIEMGVFFSWMKWLAKFFIIIAMVAIGFNTDVVKLLKTGGRPLALGAICWIGITLVSLLMQHFLGLW